MNEKINQKKHVKRTNAIVIKKLKGKASGFTQGSVGLTIEFLRTFWTYYD